MKLANFKCEKCEHEVEEIFKDTEEIPDDLGACPECGGILKKWNFKNNKHRVMIFDHGGI